MVCYSVSNMAVSTGEVNDGITFEQSVLAKSMNQKPLYNMILITKLARDSWTLEQLDTEYCNPAAHAQRVNKP